MDLRGLSWLVFLAVVLTAILPRDATSSPTPSAPSTGSSLYSAPLSVTTSGSPLSTSSANSSATPTGSSSSMYSAPPSAPSTGSSSPTSLPIQPPSPTTHIQDSPTREENGDGVTIGDGGGGGSDEGDLSDEEYDDGDEYDSDDDDAYDNDSDEYVDEYDEHDDTYENDTDDSDDDNASYENDDDDDDDDDNEEYDDIYDDYDDGSSYDDDVDDDVNESDEYDEYDENVSHDNYSSAYDGTVQTYWRNDIDEYYDDYEDEDYVDDNDDDIDNDSNDMEDDVEDTASIAKNSDDDDDNDDDGVNSDANNSDSVEYGSSIEIKDYTDDKNTTKLDHKFQMAKLTKQGKGEEGMVYLFLDDDYGNISPINITMNEIDDEQIRGKINDSDSNISIIHISNIPENIYNDSNGTINNVNHEELNNEQNSNNETKISNNNGDEIIEMGKNESILSNNNTIKSKDTNNIAIKIYADKIDTAIKNNHTSSTNTIDKDKIDENVTDINKNESTMQNYNTSSTNSSHELGSTGVSSPSTVVYSQSTTPSPSTDNSTLPTIVPGEGYVPQQETLIVLSDEQLRLLGETSLSMNDLDQETNTRAYNKLDHRTGITAKNEENTDDYASHTSSIALWPTEAPKNSGLGTKQSKEENIQSSIEMTREEVKQLLKQYGVVEGSGFEEEWEGSESESEETSEDQDDAKSRSLKYQKLLKEPLSPVPLSIMLTNPELTTLQTILISQNTSRSTVVTSEMPLNLNSTTSQIPLNSDPPTTMVSLNVTQSTSQMPFNSSLSNFTSPNNPETTVSPVTFNSSSPTTEFFNTAIFTSQNPSTPITNAPQVPLESVQPTTQAPLNSDTTTDDGDSISDLSAAYETIISSPVLPAKERNAVGHLERLRRAVDNFGGLRAVQKSITVHHIVKRQLRGDEACGVFSRRRRRETRAHEHSETSSNAEYHLTESLPVTSKLINYIEGESEANNFVEIGEHKFGRRNIKITGENEGGARNKRGINNVGKRLENGNAGYRQLFNQYKKMCEFIAMAVFE